MSNAIAFVAGCLLWFLGFTLWRQVAGLRRDRKLVQRLGAELEALLPTLRRAVPMVVSFSGGSADGQRMAINSANWPDQIASLESEAGEQEIYQQTEEVRDGARVYRLARVEKI